MDLKRYQSGFSLIELIIVISILGILAAAAYSNFKVTKEKMACKNIYSTLQTAKMRAISTGYKAYVDFDMDGGNVSDNFYTTYLDTDRDTAFGETNNGSGDNEFTESNFAMPDESGGVPGVALPTGISFGGKSGVSSGGTMGTTSGWGNIPDDGVSFSGGADRASFNSRGTGSAGSVYLYDTTDSRGVGCAVRVASTGIIRRESWDGNNWK